MILQAERLANARLQHQKQQAEIGTKTRPRSAPRDKRPSLPTTNGPQPLSCIIDDSALLAGLQEQDELKQWIRNGAINLFVPMYSKKYLICS